MSPEMQVHATYIHYTCISSLIYSQWVISGWVTFTMLVNYVGIPTEQGGCAKSPEEEAATKVAAEERRAVGRREILTQRVPEQRFIFTCVLLTAHVSRTFECSIMYVYYVHVYTLVVVRFRDVFNDRATSQYVQRQAMFSCLHAIYRI